MNFKEIQTSQLMTYSSQSLDRIVHKHTTKDSEGKGKVEEYIPNNQTQDQKNIKHSIHQTEANSTALFS